MQPDRQHSGGARAGLGGARSRRGSGQDQPAPPRGQGSVSRAGRGCAQSIHRSPQGRVGSCQRFLSRVGGASRGTSKAGPLQKQCVVWTPVDRLALWWGYRSALVEAGPARLLCCSRNLLRVCSRLHTPLQCPRGSMRPRCGPWELPQQLLVLRKRPHPHLSTIAAVRIDQHVQ